ncbi:MAG: DUF1015 domain-containing protein [Spirochaetes bacterium]|nr:DUF1015 domain-containing protein [Spirochaetota bacterium]
MQPLRAIRNKVKKVNMVKPFKALRYNTRYFRNPGQFLCWPYDIIDQAKQEEFYRKNPYNVIRMDLGKIKRFDSKNDNRYTRSKQYLKEWKKKSILKTEKGFSMYCYELKYALPFFKEVKTIRGFIALVKLQDYKERRILPHEDVLAKPLEDRFQLTVTTNTQFSPIYALYHDKKNIIDNMLEKCINENDPEIDYQEFKDLHHKFWRVSDSGIIKKIQKVMKKKLIYIADGHHRYHTMLNYRNYYKKKHNIPKKVDHPVDYIMMFLVNMDHQGLSLLPTHRILYNLGDMKLKALLSHIKDYFQLEVYNFSNTKEEKEARKKWYEDLKAKGHRMHAFGIYIKNMKRYFLLTLRNTQAYLKMSRVKKSKDWKRLDVNIIHTLLIDYILHLTKKDISNQIYIDYTKDFKEAIDKVKRNKHQVAIIQNSPRVREAIKIANHNERMPQKTTYFYPKVITGMVIYEMEKDKIPLKSSRFFSKLQKKNKTRL